jgi:hypothetical protein
MTSRGGAAADKYLPRSFHHASQRLSYSMRSSMEHRERSCSGSHTPASSMRHVYWSRSEPRTMLWNRLQESARDEMSRAQSYRAISSMSSGERVRRTCVSNHVLAPDILRCSQMPPRPSALRRLLSIALVLSPGTIPRSTASVTVI